MKKAIIVLLVLLVGSLGTVGWLVVQRTQLTTNVQDIEKQLELASSSLDGVMAQLQAVEADLDELNGKFPPKRFADITALDSWLSNQPLPSYESSDAIQWLDRALQTQAAALSEGYIISVELQPGSSYGYYIVYCTAYLQDGSLYWWDPDIKEVSYWLDYRHF